MKTTELIDAYSSKEDLRKLLTTDQRKAERLILPLTITYVIPQTHQWSRPVQLIDISGSGLTFIDGHHYKKHTLLTFKIELADHHDPIIVDSEVMWCKKIVSRRKQKDFQKGIHFHKMNFEDRKRFVTFFSEKILETNIDSLLTNNPLFQRNRPEKRSSKR